MRLPHRSKISSRLDHVVEQALDERRIVGTVVLAARDGEVFYRRAVGLTDREKGVLMTEDAIFRLASITKPIVAATAMSLVEDGVLDLDAPVTRWLPEFRPALPDGTRPPLEVRRLLTHTSGLGYGFLELSDGPYHRLQVSDGLDQPGLSLGENLSRLAAAPLLFRPGSGWHYSLGYDVLGGIIEAIEGRDLGEIVRARVTGPLDMADTDFRVRDTARLAKAYADGSSEPIPMRDGIAVPFGPSEAVFSPSRILDPRSYPSGGAGMAGTASDVLRFLETIRGGGAPMLRAETVEAMITDQVGPAIETQDPGWGYGYGWAVLTDPSPSGTPQAAGTLRWGGVYGHSWFVDPANRLTVVALTNTAFEGMSGAFPTAVRDAVYA